MVNIAALAQNPLAQQPEQLKAKPPLAVIGGGLAGLSAAWLLKDKYEVTLFESHERVGMGVFTSDYHSNGISTRIDIPLRIFTKGYYPQLFALYNHLNIEMEHSDHASVFQTVDSHSKVKSNSQLVSPFFQYNNVKLFNKRFRYLSRSSVNIPSLKIIMAQSAFFKQVKNDVVSQNESLKSITFEQYLSQHSFNQTFVYYMLLPALSVTCTCDYQGILNYPADVILGYLNCGVMDDGIVRAKQGVDGIVPKITQGIKVCCAQEVQSLSLNNPLGPIVLLSKNKTSNTLKQFSFTKVVIATQANIAQALLAIDAAEGSVQYQQSRLLARIPIQSSSMTLHTDTSVVYHHKKVAPVSYIVNGKESSTSVDLTKAFSTYKLQQSVYQMQTLQLIQRVLLASNNLRAL